MTVAEYSRINFTNEMQFALKKVLTLAFAEFNLELNSFCTYEPQGTVRINDNLISKKIR